MRKTALNFLMILAASSGLAACAHKGANGDGVKIAAAEGENISKPKRALLLAPKKGGDASIGVNGFLWRATLDTLNFMPTLSADPFGGTFLTDWHASADHPNERFKIQVFILDTRLRADGIAVQVFKQTKNGNEWVDANVDPDTPLQIENAILTRARQLRIATLESNK